MKGAKADGLRYEKRVGKFLQRFGEVHPGLWLAFKDASGRGLCQPDFILRKGNRVVVIEVKRTFRPEAYEKLRLLYLPVTQVFFPNCTYYGVLQITKILTPDAIGVRRISPREMLEQMPHEDCLYFAPQV